MQTEPWKIDAYTITFDERGATIVHQIRGDRYCVNAATATNRLHFFRSHLDLCCAMVGDHPEDLEPFRVSVVDGDSIGAFFTRLAELIAMAADEIEVELEDVHEVEITCALDIWQVTLCGATVFVWDYDHNGRLEAMRARDEEDLYGFPEREETIFRRNAQLLRESAFAGVSFHPQSQFRPAAAGVWRKAE